MLLVRLLILLSFTITAGWTLAQPVASPLPAAPIGSTEYRNALVALRDRLRDTPAPPLTAREQTECADWMLKANPAIKHVLTGHHVVVMATDGFAERAAKSNFLLNADLGYEVLVHLWGVDPCARVGRRFFIWPDPDMSGGHRCNKADLRIPVGRGDWDNAEWFERFFHEMTHGFQYAHPAEHVMQGGFFEGWAEFMQAAVSDHLSPLGEPFAGRADTYASQFPASSQLEYLRTRLPIEEIISYDPSAGFLMELVNSTKSSTSDERDWTPIRSLLQRPFKEPRWTPWHLWPVMMASDCMAAFGEARARPILAKYRFPLDRASLEQAAAQNWGTAKPDPSPREPIQGTDGWFCIGPIENPKQNGLEWDPIDAEDMAWRWHTVAPDEKSPPIEESRKLAWRKVTPGSDGMIPLADRTGRPAYYYLATTLSPDLRTELTLYISSDDECAAWLDGKLVYFFRGRRGCTPANPDVVYADAGGTRGQLVVLVMNHDGPSAFSLAAAKGGLLFKGFEERFASKDPAERAAAAAYVASRRFQQPTARMLAHAVKDPDPTVRAAVRWWPDLRPNHGDSVEAEDAYFRGSIIGGFYWNNEGSSGNQCVARGWGSSTSNWLSLPLIAPSDTTYTVRIRYACPNQAGMRIRLRRGDNYVFTSQAQVFKPSGRGVTQWTWHEFSTPKLSKGVYHVELIEPTGGADIDAVSLVAR